MPTVLAVVACLVAPSLGVGLILDDFGLRASALGLDVGRGRMLLHPPDRFDMFHFGRSSGEGRVALLDAELSPWWTSPVGRVSFLRPLASASHWLDFQLFPHAYWLMHLENIVVVLGIICVWRGLYTRLMGADSGRPNSWVVGLATVFFAFNPGLATSAGWIASRNTLLAALMGGLALLAQDRWRRDGWRHGAWVAPLTFALSLAASEAGLGALMLLLSYAIVLDGPTVRRRAIGLAPHAVVALVWAIAYRSLGYGASGSTMYVDPTRDPMAFLRNALLTIPLNLGGELGSLPSSLFMFLAARVVPALALVSAAFVVIATVAVWPALRRDPAMRFFALGAALSVLPLASTYPHDRNLAFTSACLCALTAKTVELAISSRAVLLRGYAAYAVFLHFAVGIPAVITSAMSMGMLAPLSNKPLAPLLADETLRGRTVVLMNPPSPIFAFPLVLANLGTDRPTPERMRVLSSGIAPMRVRRTASNALRVHVDGGLLPRPATWPYAAGPATAAKPDYMAQHMNSLFRGVDEPMHVGDTVTLDGFRVEVLGVTDSGSPDDLAFTFDRALEDDSLCWYAWDGVEYVRFVPPKLGVEGMLPAVPMTM